MLYIKNKRILYNKTKYSKMFGLIFLIIFIIMMIIGICVYNLYSKNLYEKNYITNMEKFRGSKENLEYKIEMAMIANDVFYDNDNVKSFAKFKGDYYEMDFMCITQIKELISEYQSKIGGAGCDIYLASFDNNFAFNYNGTLNILEFEAEIGLSREKFEQLFKKSEVGTEYRYVLNENKQFVFVGKNSYYIGSDIYVLFVFDMEDIEYYVNDEEKCFIYIESTEEQIPVEYFDDFFEWVYVNDSKNIMNIKHNNQIIFYSKFRPLNNIFLIGSYMREKTHVLGILIFILCLILSFIVSGVISKIIYQPFMKIFKILGKGNNLQNQSIENIIYNVNQLVNKYMLAEELSKKQNRLLREHTMRDILKGEIWGEKATVFISEYKMEYIEKHSRMFVLQMDEKCMYENTFDLNELSTIMESISVLFEKKFSEFGINSIRVSVDRLKTLFIFRKTVGSEILIDSFCDSVYSEYGIKVVAIFSKSYETMEELCLAYEELSVFSLKTLGNINRNLIFLNEESKMTADRVVYPIEKELEVIEKCIDGDKVYLMHIIKGIFERSKDSFKSHSLKNAMLLTVERILDAINETPEKVFDDKIDEYKKIKRKMNSQDNYEEIKWIFETVIDYIINRKQEMATLDPQCEEILTYIENNLHIDLSLDDVKMHFKVSSTFINKILKERSGTTFKKYLNECRVNRACKILKEDKFIKIATVAESVGFNSTASFVRVFRQTTGVNPTQYRDEMSKR